MKFMGTYPVAQNELRKALKAAFPGSQLPSAGQILDSSIPYLDATCEETLRMAGTSKGSLRQALCDTTILGYIIPKGAEILLNYHINRQPLAANESQRSPSSRYLAYRRGDCFANFAGRDLASFEPRRWLKEDTEGRQTFNAYALPALSFGGGYRGCFGESCSNFTIQWPSMPVPIFSEACQLILRT